MTTEKYYGQECQDDELNEKFRNLHRDLVNTIIKFCKDNDLEIDEASLRIDGLKDSIPFGEWQACTDSSLVFYTNNRNLKEIQKPFIYSM